MKVVIDTNILIDGFKDEYAYEKRIIDEIIAGRIIAAANRQTIQENQLILKRLIENNTYQELMKQFFMKLQLVSNRHTVQVVTDPEDNKILESAVESGAQFLITNDYDLLQLQSYEGIQILTPGNFWAEYSEVQGSKWNDLANFFSTSEEYGNKQ